MREPLTRCGPGSTSPATRTRTVRAHGRQVVQLVGAAALVAVLAWKLFGPGNGTDVPAHDAGAVRSTVPTPSTQPPAADVSPQPTVAPPVDPTTAPPATVAAPPTDSRVALQDSLTAARDLALPTGSYAAVTLAGLAAAVPTAKFVPATQAAAPGEVSVRVVDADSLVLVAAVADGSCQGAYDSPAGLQLYYTPAPCDADSLQYDTHSS